MGKRNQTKMRNSKFNYLSIAAITQSTAAQMIAMHFRQPMNRIIHFDLCLYPRSKQSTEIRSFFDESQFSTNYSSIRKLGRPTKNKLHNAQPSDGSSTSTQSQWKAQCAFGTLGRCKPYRCCFGRLQPATPERKRICRNYDRRATHKIH